MGRATGYGVQVNKRGRPGSHNMIKDSATLADVADEVADTVSGVVNGILDVIKEFFSGNWQIIVVGAVAVIVLIRR